MVFLFKVNLQKSHCQQYIYYFKFLIDKKPLETKKAAKESQLLYRENISISELRCHQYREHDRALIPLLSPSEFLQLQYRSAKFYQPLDD